jgi:hypothetical protein
MATRPIACGLLAALAIVRAADAQERPNLSGTWTADTASASPGPKPAPPVFGQQFTIDQKGQDVIVTRTFTGGPATITYTPGSETTSRMPGRVCEPDSGAVWNSAWDGGALTVHMVGAMPANGKTIKMDVKSSLRLESPDTLRVEMAARVPNQEAPRVTSTIYKRSAPTTSPAPAAVAPVAKATIAQVSWISGTWIGVASSGTIFEERWTPTAAGSMMAVARTIRDGLMSAFEFLCIVERNGGLVYQAMPNGRSPATDFTLTTIDADNAIFENPAHDFPKKVRYTKLPDGSLEAVVSGDPASKPLRYVFKRQE